MGELRSSIRWPRSKLAVVTSHSMGNSPAWARMVYFCSPVTWPPGANRGAVAVVIPDPSPVRDAVEMHSTAVFGTVRGK